MVGRTTLIKVTLNRLPNYVMQLIKLPTNITNQLELYQQNFLWVTTPQVHLIKWETIQSPKECGGLGIQNLSDKNNALLR